MEPVPTGGKLGFVEATSPGQCVGTLRWDESSSFPPLPAWPAPLVGDEMAMPEGWRDYLEMRLVPDAGGVAAAIPAWVPDAPEDVRLHEHALEIIRLREGIVPIPPSLSLEP